MLRGLFAYSEGMQGLLQDENDRTKLAAETKKLGQEIQDKIKLYETIKVLVKQLKEMAQTDPNEITNWLNLFIKTLADCQSKDQAVVVALRDLNSQIESYGQVLELQYQKEKLTLVANAASSSIDAKMKN